MINPQVSISGSTIAGWEKSLKSGDSVHFKVMEKLTGGRYFIRLGDTVLTVTSRVQLIPGSHVRGTVIQKDGTVMIRLAGGEAGVSGQSLGSLGRLSSGESGILRAFMLAGLSLDPALLQKMTRLSQNGKEEPQFISRFISLLLQKGIEPNSDYIHALSSFIPSYGDSGDRGPQDHPSHEQPEGEDSSENGDAAEFRKQLRRQWSKTEKTSPLHLFNHVSAGNEHWILLPFDTTLGNHSVNGWLAFKLRRESGKPVSAFVKCRGSLGEADFFFEGLGDNGRRTFRVHFPDHESSLRESFLSGQIIEKLRNLGFEYDDNNNEGVVFDGFSAEVMPQIQGIERFV